MAEITYEEFDKTVAVDLKGKDGVKGCIVIPPLKEVLQDF